jgi:hypothetical protein
MTQEFTAHYRLPIPDFKIVPWHQAWEDSLRAVDEALYLSTITDAPMWMNSTQYFITDMVLDPQQGTLWVCRVDHTSYAAPVTFAEFRAAQPAIWQGVSNVPINRGVWASGVSYYNNDFVLSGSKYAVCLIPHVSGASFEVDETAGRWSVLVDVGQSFVAINDLPAESTPAAATIDLGSFASSRLTITGVAPGGQITNFGTVPDTFKILIFGSAGNTIASNANIQLPDGQPIAAAANDIYYFFSVSSGVWILWGRLRKFDANFFNDIKQPATTTYAGVVELAVDGEVLLKTDTTRAITPSNLAALGATQTLSGLIEIATNAEALAKVDATRALTPANLAALDATQTASGMVELATNAEAAAMADATKALNPANLPFLIATETAKGLIEIATQDETQAFFDQTRAVTPGGLGGLLTTTSIKGLTRYANTAETRAGTVPDAAVTPAGLGQTLATETQKGLIEIATDAEVLARTDSTRAVTPSGLLNFIATTTQVGFVETATVAEAQAMAHTGVVLTPSNLADVMASRALVESDAVTPLRFPIAGHIKYAPGTAKAWGICDTNGALMAGYNITSISDSGTGLVQVGIDIDFTTSLNCPIIIPLTVGLDRSCGLNSAPTAASFNACCFNTAGTAADPTRYYFAAWGPQL